VHRVEPVTRGQRVASFFWVQSMVRSDEQRRLLFDMDMNLLRCAAAIPPVHGEGDRDPRPDRHVPQPAAPVGRDLSTTAAAAPVNLADYAALARARLRRAAWAYFSGGAADEITLRDNRRRLAAPAPAAARAAPLAGGHTGPPAAGPQLAHPLLVAPMAHQRLAHPTARRPPRWPRRAGRRLRAQHPVQPADGRRGPAFLPDPGAGRCGSSSIGRPTAATCALVRRAEAAGFEAMVLTVDAPVQGVRDRERRAGFACRPAWWRRQPAAGRAPVDLPPGGSPLDGLLHHAPTWADVAWLRQTPRCRCCSRACCTRPTPARPRAGRRRAHREQPRRPHARHHARQRRRAAAHRRRAAVQGAARCWSTAASAAAPTCSRRWRSAPGGARRPPVLHGLAVGGAPGVAHVLRLLRTSWRPRWR
jgi:4-hydroxymandelate oxidase